MILELKSVDYNEDNLLEIKEEDRKKIEDVITYDDILDYYIEHIFSLKQKLVSFKDAKNNGIIYTNSEGGTIWNVNKFNPETFEIEMDGTVDRAHIDIFYKELKNIGIVTKLPDLKPQILKNNLNNFFKNEFGLTIRNWFIYIMRYILKKKFI